MRRRLGYADKGNKHSRDCSPGGRLINRIQLVARANKRSFPLFRCFNRCFPFGYFFKWENSQRESRSIGTLLRQRFYRSAIERRKDRNTFPRNPVIGTSFQARGRLIHEISSITVQGGYEGPCLRNDS